MSQLGPELLGPLLSARSVGFCVSGLSCRLRADKFWADTARCSGEAEDWKPDPCWQEDLYTSEATIVKKEQEQHFLCEKRQPGPKT